MSIEHAKRGSALRSWHTFACAPVLMRYTETVAEAMGVSPLALWRAINSAEPNK
jgi:hypothetical protein